MSRKRDPHVNPVTRRELLAQGLLGVGTFAVMPSVLGLYSREARAAELACSAAVDPTKRMIPIIVVDLVGGANIAGSNVMVGDRAGQLSFLEDRAYENIGLAPEGAPTRIAPNVELGLAFHANSPMLAGIKQFAQPDVIASTDGAVFCASSGDDRETNPFNPLYWIAKSGLSGQLVWSGSGAGHPRQVHRA